MRRRLALVAAALGGVATLGSFRLLGVSRDKSIWIGWLVYALVVLVAMGVAVGLTVAYALGGLSHRWAAAAIALFVAGAFLGGSAGFFAGYGSAILVGAAMAAGDPLPPADPNDQRLYAPMPRGDQRPSRPTARG